MLLLHRAWVYNNFLNTFHDNVTSAEVSVFRVSKIVTSKADLELTDTKIKKELIEIMVLPMRCEKLEFFHLRETSTVNPTLISTNWRLVQVEKSVLFMDHQLINSETTIKYLESHSDVPESC